MPLYQKVPAGPVAASVAALIRPSISGTTFQAPYTTTLTATSSRFLSQVSTSTRLQIITAAGIRHNLGLATSIANNGSLNFTTFRPDSVAGLCVLPLDTGSPTTGTTFIVQSSNTAFTIASGSYYMLANTGLLGPYSMTLADSNFTLQFSYDSAYFAWATANSTGSELNAGINLVSASSVAPGTIYYLNDRILRIA